MNLILASTSIFRQQLLEQLNIPFIAMAPEVNEEAFHSQNLLPDQLALKLSQEKALAVQRKRPNAIIIGSDQVAALESHILGKPITIDRAIEQLSLMAGKTHTLLTAVTVLTPEKEYQFLNTTKLTMKSLSEKQISDYVNKEKPLKCAGSYKIESLGIRLFEKVDTSDFNAIIGLPLIELGQVLDNYFPL